MSGAQLGVGILGAGPVAQAIHLPTLARLTEQFRVISVMDIDAAVAEEVAARCDARATTHDADVINDPAVDVVVVGSPHHIHPRQVAAACHAGKKAILCEKPLAMDRVDAVQIRDTVRESGVPLVVGAMHTFDPGWLAVSDEIDALVGVAHTVRSSIVLPPNSRFEDYATDIVTRPERQPASRPTAESASRGFIGGVMGLAIHDLPLIRRFVPDLDGVELLSAEVRRPGGYLFHLQTGTTHIRVDAIAARTIWQPSWTLDVISDDVAVHVDFTPSYVHAGSAIGRVRRDGTTATYGPYSSNGYEEEWLYVGRLIRGEAAHPDVQQVVDDVLFAIDMADRGAEFIRTHFVPEQAC